MAVQTRSKYLPQADRIAERGVRASRARFEPRNYGNADRVGLSTIIPVCAAPTRGSNRPNIKQPPYAGARVARYSWISLLPRRAMPRKVMSRRMTRLGTVVEGRT
jgi:hypothetical protein